MTPVTTSAFDLPEHLVAKADPALIGADEQHFAAMAESLEQTIADLTQRLDDERRAPGGAGQEALDRDLEIHRLTARLRALRRFSLDLCLGRMVGDNGAEPVYVGRFGLTDRTGRRLLVDWRSPAAEPFFGATHGNPMGLASRRRYRWARGRINDYWDEVFTPDGLEGNAALDDQSAFIASLGDSRSGRMRDVLGTIQADQDAVIRAGSRGTLVVDGGPGTGQDGRRPAPRGVPPVRRPAPRRRPRRRARGRSAPAVPRLRRRRAAQPRRGRRADLHPARPAPGRARPRRTSTDPEVARLKATAEMVTAIEPAVGFYEEPPTEGMEVETPWADVWVSTHDWVEAFESLEPGTPHNEGRDQVWDELLTILVDKHEGRRRDVSEELVRRALAQHDGPRRRLRRGPGR